MLELKDPISWSLGKSNHAQNQMQSPNGHVDPVEEDISHKLRKVESFIDYFKSRCLALYQPRQNLAIDERMDKSRHRSGIRQ